MTDDRIRQAFPDAPQRFIDKIAINPISRCWEWIAADNGLGYGRFVWHGKLEYSHRLAFQWAKGPLAARVKVRHSCDNPPCCFPGHLLAGSQWDNVQDAIERGLWPDRQTTGRRGADCPQAKLTEEQAIAIKADRRILREVAADYGVSISTVWFIRAEWHWKHLS